MNTVTHPAPAVTDATARQNHRISAGRRLAAGTLAKVLANNLTEAECLAVWAKAEELHQARWNLEIAITGATTRIVDAVRTSIDGPRATPQELGRE